MSNPLRAPKTEISLTDTPSAYFEGGAEYQQMVESMKKVEVVQERLRGLDMVVRPTFDIPREWTVDPATLAKAGAAMALANTGRPVFRVRSGEGFNLMSAIYQALPKRGFVSQSEVADVIRDKFMVDAGTEMTLGRIQEYYPKVGSVIAWPISRTEAEAALDNCGLRINHYPAHAVRPYPLIAEEGTAAVTVNPKSDNGYPVLGKWETPGASAKAYELAVVVRKELTALNKGGVYGWVRQQELDRPWLVTLRGKAKGDYYSAKKIQRGALRFYNALPRQILLNMQVVTQPLESLAKSIFDGSRTAQGISLVRGGAARLVDKLQEQLESEGHAYTHVGDDSWILVQVDERIVAFALDCSSFDLTQHEAATRQVHEALRRQLQSIDYYGAELWYAYARERQVVVAGALVRQWKHAGPSGMPLQSKVNDMLMDVLINRALASVCDWTDEEAVDSLLRTVGENLGFRVRVEQHSVVSAGSVKEFLTHQPFLFIGYWFHVRDDHVVVACDIARSLAQMPYPGLKWMKGEHEREVMEAMRLGSIALNAGIAPRGYERAFAEWRNGAIDLVRVAIRKHGDVVDPKLRWAVSEAPWAVPAGASLSGLLRALETPAEALWGWEFELPSTSRLMLTDWASMVEQEEEEAQARKEMYIPPPASRELSRIEKAVRRLKEVRRPTHPVTEKNDGRPHPTAVWGPPKPPRQSPFEGAVKSRKLRRGRVLPGDMDEEEWSEDSWEFFDDFGHLEKFEYDFSGE